MRIAACAIAGLLLSYLAGVFVAWDWWWAASATMEIRTYYLFLATLAAWAGGMLGADL